MDQDALSVTMITGLVQGYCVQVGRLARESLHGIRGGENTDWPNGSDLQEIRAILPVCARESWGHSLTG